MSDPKENTQNTEETVPSEEIKEEEAAPAPEEEIPEAPAEEIPEAPAEEPAEDEAEKLRKDMASEKERYLRLAAEYDNFRKRSARERDSIYADVKADTIVKLLPVFDNLQRALENPTAETRSRAQVLTGGMLLLNEWHSRPEDFSETALVSLGKYYGGNDKVQVNDYNVKMFPNAADALKEALDAARAEDLTHYIVTEGYRSWDEQNTMFQNRVNKLSSRYSGDALIEAAKKEVNYPGTSEFNSGLSCTLKLYDKDDPEVTNSKFSTTSQGKWMNENCWKYGLVLRFPLANWPLETTQDKSFKTGVSVKLNLYRFVGKGNAAVMHYMDFCMEEYIEYLEEHPHIALFEDGVLKYEIYRQYVGDSESFDVQLTRNARSWSTSLDNMGAIITVFEY